ALKQSAESFSSLFEATGEGLIIHDGGPILAANRTYAAMMGYEVADVVGRDGLAFLAPETRALSASLSRAGDERPYTAALVRRDGTHLPVEIAGKAIRYLGRPARLATLRDITARQEAETALRESEAGLAEAQRIAQLGSWSWDIATDRVTWTAELYRIFGLSPEEFTPTIAGYLEHIHPDDRAQAGSIFAATYQGGATFRGEQRIVRPDGTIRMVQSRGLVTRDAAGNPLRVVGTCHDVTERKALEARLAHQATHDPLTGLPNRALFNDRLNQSLARARRDGHPCAVLLLDLDRFKEVNDSLGHATGDRLLVAVAERLRRALREADTLARLGGDEFAILLEGVDDLSEALRVAARLQEALVDPVELDGRTLFAAASMGVALRASVEDGPEELLRYADVALYRAKGAGGGCAEAFYPGMNAEA
ncbi:MAG TPA: diguanylate cyclase, partial [Gemmatimonadales bacterium]|nr:diguanylate cyclase [Gemmatimonadales bacterium]